MLSLFAAALALVPCPSVSPLACHCRRCCHCRQRWQTRPTNHCRPQPLLPSRHRTSFCCRAILCLGPQLSTLTPLPTPPPTTMPMPVRRIPPPRFELHRRPPPPPTNHCCHQSVFAAAANLIAFTLLSVAAILAILGPPSLLPFLVCGRHPCHLFFIVVL